MEKEKEYVRDEGNEPRGTARPVENSDDGNGDRPPIGTRPVNYTNNSVVARREEEITPEK